MQPPRCATNFAEVHHVKILDNSSAGILADSVHGSLNRILAAMVMAPEGALASSFIKYSNLKSTQKLSTTPVFYLSNSGGSPYLQEDVQVKSGVIVYNQP